MDDQRRPGMINRIFSDRNLSWLAIGVVMLGIALRLAVFFQNRCLIIDEANVARNISERGFAGLTAPLSYEQYAPPVYLWTVKLSTVMLGMGEMALRLPALLAGIIMLWLLYKALKEYATVDAAWYSLFIIATGLFYIRYSAELKQYMGDAALALALILMAIRTDIFTTSRIRFVAIWAITGSVAVWLSMPSVFIMTGIGAYYFYQCMRAKDYSRITPIMLISFIWLAQFLLYYFTILKPQIKSDYLQNYHKDSFLFKFPITRYKWTYNMTVLDIVFSNMGGKWALSVAFHAVTFFIGAYWLLRKHTAKALLLIMPVACLYVAAGFRQFALVPRVILFILPLLMILIATGLHVLLSIRYTAVKALWIAIAAICIWNYNGVKDVANRLELEELTQSMQFIKEQGVSGRHVYVNCAAVPAYLYYTTIHPGKENWKDIANANPLYWYTSYDSLGRTFSGRSALLYGWWPEDNINRETGAIRSNNTEVMSFIKPQTRAYIYE